MNRATRRHATPWLAATLALTLAVGACTSGSSAKSSAKAQPARAASQTAAPVPSPGCGTSSAHAVDADARTMSVGGRERSYLLTVPPAHDGHRPLPLVLDFHGLAEGAQIHSKMSNFGALANQEGFVVAFPNGMGQPQRWDLSIPPKPNPDLAFVDQLLDTLGRQLCIDTSRVYASGLSFGAFMSSFLACAQTDKFAAVAPVAGVTIYKDCTPTRPMPVIAFHGTGDPILRFNGGVGPIPGITAPIPKPGATTTTLPPADLNGTGYPANVAAWAQRNGCDPTPTDTKLSSEVIHRVYHCPAGQDVEFYIIIGGGHAWPGSEFSRQVANIIGYTSMQIDATKTIWDFFKRFRLNINKAAATHG